MLTFRSPRGSRDSPPMYPKSESSQPLEGLFFEREKIEDARRIHPTILKSGTREPRGKFLASSLLTLLGKTTRLPPGDVPPPSSKSRNHRAVKRISRPPFFVHRPSPPSPSSNYIIRQDGHFLSTVHAYTSTRDGLAKNDTRDHAD